MTVNSPIIDGQARSAAAEVLRRFIAGQITNDSFEDQVPETDDPAIWAIWDTCWLFYDDFKEHRLDGKYRLSPDLRRQLSRWVLFLDSDLPYQWPKMRFPGRDPRPFTMRNPIKRFLTHGSIHPELTEKFLAAGHYPVWPFVSVKDYKAALAAPKRLSGGRSRKMMETAQ